MMEVLCPIAFGFEDFEFAAEVYIYCQDTCIIIELAHVVWS